MTTTHTVAQSIVLVFGTAVCVLSVWAMIVPDRLRRWISALTDQPWGYYFAAGVRLLLGLALVFAAPDSRFPVVFQVLGWLTIAAALGLLIFGQDRLRKLVAWFNQLPDWVYRAWLLVAVVFGLFLVYGVS